MDDKDAIQLIAIESGLAVSNPDELNRVWLAEKINELINHDFSRLVSILYRVDVDEAKLRNLLKSNAGQDAAPVIADLLIERQAQKKKWKDKFSGHTPANDEEKW